jgi:Fur family peroxide stress response transcriptional regulator
MDYISLLKDKCLKATPQRLSVLKVLYRNCHPNIDELYEAIKEDFPSISLATVYKNINMLKYSGVVIEINAPSGKSRYDIYIKPHAHIVCKNCGAVEDAIFLDSIYQYRQELEVRSHYNIQRLDVTATVESCKHCD